MRLFFREQSAPIENSCFNFNSSARPTMFVTSASLIAVNINLLMFARASSVSRNLRSNNRSESDSSLVTRGNARNFRTPLMAIRFPPLWIFQSETPISAEREDIGENSKKFANVRQVKRSKLLTVEENFYAENYTYRGNRSISLS